MTGQLITSFHQETENPTMTSTTCNLCAEPVMAESKTGCCNVSAGAILDTARARVKRGGGSYWSGYRPGLLRLRRAKHRGTLIKYGWRAQLLWIRLSWRSHWGPAVSNYIIKLKNKKV
jgi:hypothetical protein